MSVEDINCIRQEKILGKAKIRQIIQDINNKIQIIRQLNEKFLFTIKKNRCMIMHKSKRDRNEAYAGGGTVPDASLHNRI